MSKYEVGQQVIVVEPSSRDGAHETVIAKVGRTLVYTDPGTWRERAFYIESGAERRPANAGGTGAILYTVEEYAERERAAALRHQLRDAGVDFKFGYRFTADQMERILAIVQEGGKK